MTYTRMLGCNIERLLASISMSRDDFAAKLGLSVHDVNKMCEGRLSLSPDELMEISDVLGIDISNLMQPDESYDEYVDCMGTFRNSNNQDKILDLIDAYIDLREAVKE